MQYFFISFLLCSAFFIIYYTLRIINFNYIKYYYLFLEVIIIAYLLFEILHENIFNIFICLLFQITLLFSFYNIYQKDVSKKKIYQCLSKLYIRPTIVYGISDIKTDDVDFLSDKIIRVLSSQRLKSAFNYFVMQYQNNKLIVDIIFWSKSDFDIFCKDKDICKNISKLEFIKKGVAVKLIIT